MATKSKPPTRLNDEQLLSVMALAKDSDSVELKLTLPEEAHRSVITALGLDPLEAEIRQVFFFDTPDLTLNERGLVVRARRAQRKGDDTVVKLRPVVPGDIRTPSANRLPSRSRWTRCPVASSARGR